MARDIDIEVIGAGLGRTGTLSLKNALDILSYKTYHFVLPEHAAVWAEYSEGRVDSDEVIDTIVNSGFSATCDQPTADLYLEQMKRYPNAKVILTVRDSGDDWSSSWMNLMEFIEVQERPFSLSYPTFLQWIPFMRQWKSMRDIMGTHIGLSRGELIRGWRNKPKGWLAEQYNAHNERVKATVPADRLLVFNVKDGWTPLCAFLGKAVPAVPFPHVNESSDIELAKKVMVFLSYAWLPMAVATADAFRRWWRWRNLNSTG